WSLPKIPELAPLQAVWLEGLVLANKKLHAHLKTLCQRYPPQGSLALTGHAHIDLAWLWTISETKRKVQRTFGTVLELMKQYPDFVFNQSSAQAYAWLEHDDPEMFSQIQSRVREGRWEPIGGMWVEPDGQMLNGESWVRQIRYGQQYFLEKFGRTSSVAWLPDTFGFSGQLPQLLRLGGMPYFFTTKMRWNETTEFPHDLFKWRGLDGSEVLAHCFWNVFDSYNAQIDPKSTLGTWRNFKGKNASAWLSANSAPQSLLAFGYGDGGGGPSREHLENYAKLKNYPALPKLEMTRVDDFFHKLPQEKLPVWYGEMYLELHRGTLTTQALVKKLHRQLEHRLLEAELLWSLAWQSGAIYPQAELERLWKILLLHQFHDILPGSSIREVYEDAHQALGAALEAATRLRDSAQPNGFLTDSLKKIQESNTPHAPSVKMLEDGGYALQAGALKVRLSKEGWLESFVYLGREYLSAPMRLTYQHDLPREWEAWDMNPPHSTPIESVGQFEALESGVRVTHHWRDSSFVQEYHLRATGLEVRCHFDWWEKRTLLRLELPTTLNANRGIFETAFGVQARSTKPNTPTEMASFEVSAQRFVLLSEGSRHLALINDCKYGFGCLGGTLTMSLLRGTMYPDPNADMGKHEFSYALDILDNQAHSAPIFSAALRALEFNSPLLAAAQALVQSQLILSSLEKSQFDSAFLLRFYEPCGVSLACRLDLNFFNPKRVQRVNLLEQEIESLLLEEGFVQLEVRAFEILSFKIFV
ncbi:MAG: alpha-mannosidase, partial [Deinococcales bacterium]